MAGKFASGDKVHHYLYAYANPTVFVDLNGYFGINDVKDGAARFAGSVVGVGVSVLGAAAEAGQLAKDGVGEQIYYRTFGVLGRESHENNEKLREGVKEVIAHPIDSGKAIGRHFKAEFDLAGAEVDRGNNFGGGAVFGKTAFDIYGVVRALPEIAKAASKASQIVTASNAARRATAAGEIAESVKPPPTAAPATPAVETIKSPAQTIKESPKNAGVVAGKKPSDTAQPKQNGVKAEAESFPEKSADAKTTANEPEVKKFIKDFERKYPGRSYQSGHIRTHSDGRKIEIDFETDNAIVEIKAGRGRGLTRQITDRQDPSINPSGKVCIGLACSKEGVSPHVKKDIEKVGGLAPSTIEDAIDVIAPNKAPYE